MENINTNKAGLFEGSFLWVGKGKGQSDPNSYSKQN